MAFISGADENFCRLISSGEDQQCQHAIQTTRSGDGDLVLWQHGAVFRIN